jgi:lysophospholipase L1-like esterase
MDPPRSGDIARGAFPFPNGARSETIARMKRLPTSLSAIFAFSLFAGPVASAAEPGSPDFKGTVLFLGDSITNAGHYISLIETELLREGRDPESFELINLGLSSEGVTGLTEPKHPFPRPNVHERLDRALEKVKPDLVFACYGMNDGIYHPFSEERFAAYQKGINTLIEKVKATGAPLVLLTPPPFDPVPLRKSGKLQPAGATEYNWVEIYEDYDTEVLARYSDWILKQKDRVAGVIDLRTPVLAAVNEKRKSDPAYTLSNDGVHLNTDGHLLIAKGIFSALGRDPGVFDTVDPEALTKVHARQTLLHDAWLTHVGHLRPQTKIGLPLWIARIAVTLPESEKARFLFNGRDFAGTITGRNTGAVPSSTYLFTKDAYRNFRLLFEVKQTVSPEHSTMHSAIAALGERIEDEGGNAFGFRGPLLMFCHDWGIWDANRRNRIEPRDQKGAMKITSEKTGGWNSIEILVTGNRIRFVNNGELVFDFTDDPAMLQDSPIGLQLHKNAKPQEWQFRGLVLTETPEDKLLTLP